MPVDFEPFSRAAWLLYNSAFVADRYSSIRAFLEKPISRCDEPLTAYLHRYFSAALLPLPADAAAARCLSTHFEDRWLCEPVKQLIRSMRDLPYFFWHFLTLSKAKFMLNLNLVSNT